MRRILFALAVLPTAVLAQTSVLNPTAGTVNLPANVHTIVDPSSPMLGQTSQPLTPPNGANANGNGKNQQGQGTLRDESVGDTSAKTAADQGYVKDNSAQLAQQAADYQATHTPRQMGIQVREPAPLNPVARQLGQAGWLANWTYTLNQAGVPEDKVSFEANRLNRTDFEAWAYRQLLTARTFP